MPETQKIKAANLKAGDRLKITRIGSSLTAVDYFELVKTQFFVSQHRVKVVTVSGGFVGPGKREIEARMVFDEDDGVEVLA